MSYEFDIFISYSQTEPSKGWVRTYLYPDLKEFLAVEAPHNFSLFLDGNDLHQGGTWNQEIKRSLHRSRILVPVFSTAYFRSAWCNAELDCMMRRERHLEMRTEDKPRGLIFPIKLHDGKYYPPIVSKITYDDFACFSHVGADSPFRQSPDYLEFRKRVQALAANLVEAAIAAPDWESGFPELVEPNSVPETITIPQPRMS